MGITEEGAIANLRRELAAARRQATRIALINRVARLITASLSADELLPLAIATIHESFGFRYVAATLLDEDGARQGSLAEAGASRSGTPLDLQAEPAATAARERRPVLHGAPSPALAMPIVVGGRLRGLIGVEHDEPLGADVTESLALIADQFGAALENARLVGGLERALEATRLLYEVSQRLGSAMSVDQVIAAYLSEVAARGPHICTVALYEFDHQERRSGVIVRGVWSPAAGVQLRQDRVPYTRDALDEPLEAGETVTIADVRTDPRVSPELRELQLRDGRPALAFIPLIARSRRFGLVILSHDRPYGWPVAELRLYQTTASQLASAVDSRLQHDLAVERARQVAILEERRRLARELHDSVTQSLFSMSMLAQVLPALWTLDREEAARSLGQIRDLTRGALAEMRELLYELRPAELGEQDLAQSLRARAGAVERRTGLPVRVDAPGMLRLPAAEAQALLRIAQEALTNADHHASAHMLTVELEAGPPLRLRIRDDGRGFDPSAVGAGRLGLISMRERAAAIGAHLEVASAPGAGTTITVTLPAE